MDQVTLSDFVSRTLSEIIKGVSDAQEYAKDTGAVIGPSLALDYKDRFKDVEFDVAVSSKEGEAAKGGLGVFLANVGIGGQVQADASREGTNRIRFSVTVQLPTQS